MEKEELGSSADEARAWRIWMVNKLDGGLCQTSRE